jgi:DNA-binding transcriptional MerR regulator
MSAEPVQGLMTIGDVLAMLRGDFPAVTVSKIRFLEAEGLIEPQRSPSGYRKFSESDVARLRLILAAQRDHYLPLRVIKEYLQARDRGEQGPPPWADRAAPPRRLVAADSTLTDATGGPPVRLTRRQLIDGAGVDEALLGRLEEAGLVRRRGAHYDGRALVIARTAAALGGYGVEARHLRAVKAAADREVGLIEQVVGPLLRRRSPGAHEQAAETARQIAALSLRLHEALVAAGLADSLDP